ncbi:MAG: threonine ammonia-lyase [Bryobacteraceae bacterium]|jgi:threonine dehydratase
MAHSVSPLTRQIHEARRCLREVLFESPCPYSQTLSDLTDNHVYLKLENLQMTGSFKERGALNKILSLTAEDRQKGVIAASAGNHAQAVAYHATRLGIRSQIVMPLATPLVKVSATRGYGAAVKLHGANYDEACHEAERICENEHLAFIHPFDDPLVIAGQGSLGLELLDQMPNLEAVVVPIGGGGLIGGLAAAIKETNSEVRVVGVQAERVPSMRAALDTGRPISLDSAVTIADGIAVRKAGQLTYPLVANYVDEIVTVDEEEIANAILVLLEREKTVAEGAGAVAVAALLQRRTSLMGKRTVAIVSGGNIDVTLVSRIIERGMVKDGRLVRLRIHLLDRPGGLHAITGVIAAARANIVELLHNRAYYGVDLGSTVIDVTLETRGPEHIDELLLALSAAGYRHERVL